MVLLPPTLLVEHEFIANYKVLQTVLSNEKIDKYIDVERLCKAKFQDNLEFLQWVKGCFDHFYDGQPYDAVARRREAASKNPLAARRDFPASVVAPTHASSAAAASTSSQSHTTARTSPNPMQKPRGAAAGHHSVSPSVGHTSSAASYVTNAVPKARAVATRPAAPASTAQAPAPATRTVPHPANQNASAAELQQLRQRVAELERKLAAEKNRREQLAFQQAFYYAKLREVELICLNKSLPFDDSMRQTLLDVMYRTEHDPSLEPEQDGLDDQEPEDIGSVEVKDSSVYQPQDSISQYPTNDNDQSFSQPAKSQEQSEPRRESLPSPDGLTSADSLADANFLQPSSQQQANPPPRSSVSRGGSGGFVEPDEF